MIQGISRNGLILGGFTLATTLLIAMTHWVTEPVINTQIQKKSLHTITQVFPEKYWNNDIAQNCVYLDNPSNGTSLKIYRGLSGDSPAGLVIEATTREGYGGNIHYLVSLIGNQTIGGVRVLEHKETPGLGDKIELRISDWVLSFDNLQADTVNRSDWAVKKDGGRFDQFTGATITPRAVVNGVKQSIELVQNQYTSIFALPNQCAASQEPSND